MEIKWTFQGLLIYATMLAYLLAFISLSARYKKLGTVFYAAGFGLAAAGFAYRWYDAGHVPLQNLFEVFLCLGMLIYPLSLSGSSSWGSGPEQLMP